MRVELLDIVRRYTYSFISPLILSDEESKYLVIHVPSSKCDLYSVIVPYIFRSSTNFECFVSSISGTEKTEVIYGSSNVIKKEIQFFSKAKFKIDSCMNHTRQALDIGIESIRK